MKVGKRLVAWLLSASMLISTPGFQIPVFGAYTDTENIQNEITVVEESAIEEKAKSEDVKVEETNSEETKIEDTQPAEETQQTEEDKIEETKAEEVQAEEIKPETTEQETVESESQDGNAELGTEESTEAETEDNIESGTVQDSAPETEVVPENKPVEDETTQVGPQEGTLDEPSIYWNPGKKIYIEETEISVVTPSEARIVKAGKNIKEGYDPCKPVRSLKVAVSKARELAEELNIPVEDVVIYAMNPMSVNAGESYSFDGKGIVLRAWDGRTDGSELIFSINGGQLLLKNTSLEANSNVNDPENTSLIQVNSGKIQLGKGAAVSGAVSLNYGEKLVVDDEEEEEVIPTATPSNAKSNEKDIFKKIEHKNQLPVIELMSGFDISKPFYLDVVADNGIEDIELVRSMYADELSADEFMGQFVFSDSSNISLELEVVQEEGKTQNETTEDIYSDRLIEDEILPEENTGESVRLTRKKLVVRSASEKIIYWNPGGEISLENGKTYHAGNDDIYDGSTPYAPLKTWSKVLEHDPTTVVCMQSLRLDDHAKEYMTFENGQFVLDGLKTENKIRLAAWTEYPRPSLILPENSKLVLRNIELKGLEVAGSTTRTSMILCEGGQLVMDENISSINGYVQVNLTGSNNADKHPIQVNSDTVSFSIYFGGINDNLKWRCLDVIVPGGALAPSLDATLEHKKEIGLILQANVYLEELNSVLIENGGTSMYEWELRPDSLEDGELEDAHKLELYTGFKLKEVFLDGIRGDDRDYGVSCLNPVKTFGRAKEVITLEINKAIEARKKAKSEGKTYDEINKIHVPKKIYICGTVIVDKNEIWDLDDFVDYDGTKIEIEIIPHTNPNEGVHEIPNTLIHVKGENAELKLGKNIIIRNTVNKKESVGIAVSNAGTLIMDENATIKGNDYYSLYGTNIIIGKAFKESTEISNGHLKLLSTYKGNISRAAYGIEVIGKDENSISTISMEGGNICNNDSSEVYSVYYGCAVVCHDNVIFTMDDGNITDNKSYKGGSGVYVDGPNSKFLMKKGKISSNMAIGTEWDDDFRGIGVYLNKGSFEMGVKGANPEECIISDNTIDENNDRPSWVDRIYGLGLCTYGKDTIIWSGTIENNSSSCVGVYYGAGASIQSDNFVMHDGLIQGNHLTKESATVYGAGMYIRPDEKNNAYVIGGVFQNNECHGYGGGIYITNEYRGGICNFENLEIKNNKAGQGGGIYIKGEQKNNSIIKNCTISGNYAKALGGGIYSKKTIVSDSSIINNTTDGQGGGIASDSSSMCRNLIIEGNRAVDGGGIQGGGSFTNIRIQNNIASNNGGGMFISASSSLTDDPNAESKVGKTAIIGNYADKNGGGLYIDANNSNVDIDLDTDIKNKAVENGNNIYWRSGNTHIYTIKLAQPEDNNSVYNIYLDGMSNGGAFYIDPNKFYVEGDKSLYLNTSASYLNYLTKPLKGNLPIDLNPIDFKVGTIVVKPTSGHKGRISYLDTNLSLLNKTYTYEEYKDVSKVPEGYYDTSILPSRTQLGGFEDPLDSSIVNTILVGEGVYIGGYGNDTNDGTSPKSAVRTFDRAKKLMEQYTDVANSSVSDPDGFSPFFYICGNIPVETNEIWEFDKSEQRYTTESKYVQYETANGREVEKPQMKRFASFVNKPLITVASGAILTFTGIEINGMMEAVDREAQGQNSPVLLVEKNGEAVLKDGYNFRNNYSGIADVKGIIRLGGTNDGSIDRVNQLEVVNEYGIKLFENAYAEMNGYSRILGVSNNLNLSGNINAVIAGDRCQLIMTDNSAIQKDDNKGRNFEYGVDIKNRYVGEIRNLSMSDNSKISDSNIGVYIASYAKVKMSGNSSVNNNNIGICLDNNTREVYVELIDNSSISHNQEDGVKVRKDNDGKFSIILDNYASIKDNLSNGINIDNYEGASNYVESEINITLNGTSSIKNNKNNGINTVAYISNIILNNSSMISGNGENGIRLARSRNWSKSKIILNGDSVISENSKLYAESYKRYGGIKIEEFISLDLEMNQNSKIENNYCIGICADGTDRTMFNGIMNGNSSIRNNRKGQVVLKVYPYYLYSNDFIIRITMNDGSSIIGTSDTNNYDSNIEINTSCEFIMNDSSHIDYSYIGKNIEPAIYLGGSFESCRDVIFTMNGNSQINAKGDAMAIVTVPSDKKGVVNKITMKDSSKISCEKANGLEFREEESEFHVEDNATINRGTLTYVDEDIIKMNGKMFLSGGANIGGRIYLINGLNPLTMTSLPDKPANGLYQLHLASGFVGQTVVRPDGVGVTDVASYINYFNKAEADGMAAKMEMFPDSEEKTIILAGDNNVYLSGQGNDNNTGSTPDDAVRSFKRAKELLEGGGYYTNGANIYICNTVTVIKDDDNWIFDNDGKVTNSKSGHTWKPVIKSYLDDGSYMVEVGKIRSGNFLDEPYYSEHLNLSNITFDIEGKNRKFIIGAVDSWKNNYAYLTLGNNSVFTGAKTNGDLFCLPKGEIIIDGANIYNNEVEEGYRLSLMSVNKGKINIKDCKISNNILIGEKSVSIISCDGENVSVKIDGGIIENNKLKADYYKPAGVICIDENYPGRTIEINGGKIINNGGCNGAAIYYGYYSGAKLSINGGVISGNYNIDGREAIGAFSPIYIDDDEFSIAGDDALIEDNIYLARPENIIKLTKPILDDKRKYNIYIDSFGPGYTIIKPDVDFVADARPYLNNFNLISKDYILDRGQLDEEAKYSGTPGIKENQCLILRKKIFLDSQNGSDNNDGTSPNKAVKTFARAKALGEQWSSKHYVIYVSGPVYPKDGETWSLPETAYMCRYTGFLVYDSNYQPIPGCDAYHGYMIEPDGRFTLNGINIYGRRYIDDNTNNGDSIIHIKDGTEVVLEDGAVLARNHNMGTFIEDGDLTQPLSSKGGAISVDAGGILKLNGGNIVESEAASGSAIYLAAGDKLASGEVIHAPGRVLLNNAPYVEGDVFLDGNMSETVVPAVVEASEIYHPGVDDMGRSNKLLIHMETEWDRKPVVKYPESFISTAKELDYYSLNDSVLSVYDFLNGQDDLNVLELYLRKNIYLDGVNGSDSNTGDSPEQALKSLEAVYAKLKADNTFIGTLVYVVDGVSVDNGETIALSNEIIQTADGRKAYKGTYEHGATRIETNAQVYFKRYAKPDDISSLTGFNKESYKGSLFNVVNGKLTLSGLYLDGHNQDSISGQPSIQAKAVEAEAPLVTVLKNGNLSCEIIGNNHNGSGGDIGSIAETVFQNNTNINAKNSIIGTDKDGNNLYEGSSAGIELLGGNCNLKQTYFHNLLLGDNVASGGADVYNNGTLTVSNATHFTGSVFLEGLGSPEDKTKSRIINIEQQGTPIKVNFSVHIRDPYNGRPVARYPESASKEDIGYYLLEDYINHYYAMAVADDGKTLELRIPDAVYIDGVNGSDTDVDGLGWSPSKPVKTLSKAYKLLKERSGKIVYVVNTVNIDNEIELTGRSYVSGDERITLSSSTDRVEFRRFVKPISTDSNYDVKDFNGTMFSIKNGGMLSLRGNEVVTPGVNSEFIVDGQRDMNNDLNEPETMRTDHGVNAESAMINIELGGQLNLNGDVILRNNNNITALDEANTFLYGGAINNSGTVIMDGSVIENNAASKGAGIYQSGEFTVQSNPSGLLKQEIYLAADTNQDSGLKDHVINMGQLLSEDEKLDINMDHAVAGRDVIVYNGYQRVDEQYNRYHLGDTVPKELFLVEAAEYDNILELQDWKVLDVEVPEEIFLAIHRTKNGAEAVNGSSNTAELSSPEYSIVNHSPYKVKVSLAGFTDASAEVGVDQQLHKPMNLVNTSEAAVGANDLYLSVKGKGETGGFSKLGEVALSDYNIEGQLVTEMGILDQAGSQDGVSEGRFSFKASASKEFIDTYMDSEFPLNGDNDMEEIRKQHYRNVDEATGKENANHARAMYRMSYRLEMIPSRRD